MKRPETLGELKAAGYRPRGVKDELRANLRQALAEGKNPFEGIHGYERTVLLCFAPQCHPFRATTSCLLGAPGQAKTRLLRQLVALLDPEIPAIAEAT